MSSYLVIQSPLLIEFSSCKVCVALLVHHTLSRNGTYSNKWYFADESQHRKKKKNMLTNRQFSGAIQIKWKRKWFSIVIHTINNYSRFAQCTILYLLVRQLQCLAYSQSTFFGFLKQNILILIELNMRIKVLKLVGFLFKEIWMPRK